VNVRPGYKQTDVGVIPEDWAVTKLGALCAAVLDCHHSTPVWTKTGAVVIRNQNIRDGRLDLSDPSFTDERHFNERTRRAVPTYGDLVITREAPMGLVCMIPEGLKCCLGQRMVLLRPNRDAAETRYLLYALLSEAVQRSISVAGGNGSTVGNLRIPVLKELQILAPESAEQRAIAGLWAMWMRCWAGWIGSSPRSATSSRPPCSNCSPAGPAYPVSTGSGRSNGWGSSARLE